MKKLLLILALAGAVSINVNAQEKRLQCSTTEENIRLMQANPGFEITRNELEDFTRDYVKNATPQRSGTRQIYIIPVVFHILHNYGPENLSDAQVIDAMNILNRDYRKLNADTVDVIPVFKPIIADVEFEFRLATIDPNGNCTNGIEHIVTNLTYLADDGSKLNDWPNNKYLNIWTAYSLLNSAAAAYAHLPGNGSAATDGIMCRYDYVGSIGTSSVVNSRTLTHEIGHHFNLLHCWGATNSPGINCSGDDQVADTPQSIGWDHCDLAGSVCNPPVIENVQNYMEYSYCDVMFTQGQKTRMHACINSAVSGRVNLWQPANLTATGTDGGPVTICAPIADFKQDHINICAGNTVQFIDQSWHAPITSWNWSFPGGNPSASNDSNPSVVYPTPGIYDATLIVTSQGGSDTITRLSTIRVSGPPTRVMPFTEDFEDSTSFPGIDGWIDNSDNSVTSTWTRVASANTTTGGSHSIKMNNFINTAGEIDSWITPSIDFSNVSFPVNISFKVANAQRNSTSADALRLYYSTNCGQSWSTTSYNKSGATLSTSGVITSNYTPNNPAQWRLENVNVNPVQGKPNVRFKFQNTSDRGNNIYIDDINITGTIIGIDEVDDMQSAFSLYPNPSNGESTVNFGLKKSSHVIIEVKNIIGQTIVSLIDKTIDAGIHENKLPVLTQGIYLVDVIVNNKHHVRKLIIS